MFDCPVVLCFLAVAVVVIIFALCFVLIGAGFCPCRDAILFFVFIPCAPFLIPCAPFLIPCAPFLIPCAPFLIPCAPFLIPCAPFLIHVHWCFGASCSCWKSINATNRVL